MARRLSVSPQAYDAFSSPLYDFVPLQICLLVKRIHRPLYSYPSLHLNCYCCCCDLNWCSHLHRSILAKKTSPIPCSHFRRLSEDFLRYFFAQAIHHYSNSKNQGRYWTKKAISSGAPVWKQSNTCCMIEASVLRSKPVISRSVAKKKTFYETKPNNLCEKTMNKVI